MSDTATTTGQNHPEVALIAARAALACATFSLCVRWLGTAGEPDTRDGEPKPFLVDGVAAFIRAWAALVKIENPKGVIEAAVDGIIVEAGWPNDMDPKVRAMLLTGLIGPIVEGMAAKLTGETRLAGLGLCLEALRQADAAGRRRAWPGNPGGAGQDQAGPTGRSRAGRHRGVPARCAGRVGERHWRAARDGAARLGDREPRRHSPASTPSSTGPADVVIRSTTCPPR